MWLARNDRAAEAVLASEIDFQARESGSGIDFILDAGARLQANRMHFRSHCALIA
jgi:hypothetical protein